MDRQGLPGQATCETSSRVQRRGGKPCGPASERKHQTPQPPRRVLDLKGFSYAKHPAHRTACGRGRRLGPRFAPSVRVSDGRRWTARFRFPMQVVRNGHRRALVDTRTGIFQSVGSTVAAAASCADGLLDRDVYIDFAASSIAPAALSESTSPVGNVRRNRTWAVNQRALPR